jgi:hypothetical protein
MRKMFQSQMPGVPPNIQNVFNEIFRASQEADIIDIGQAYTFTGSFTKTRQLNVTTPTLANAVAVLATLISDLQSGGSTKST